MMRGFQFKTRQTGLGKACLAASLLSLLLFPPLAAIPAMAAAPQTLEARALLQSSWERYKTAFIQADGRVIDRNGNITTSEGQSYAMLRAFWVRDRETFDRVYRWTKNNLQVPRGDHLFSWKWGELPDHTWGALDKTSASDADQDIALALILAHQEWHDAVYLEDARKTLADIWERLTFDSPVGRVLLPGDWPQRTQTRQVNPSYFMPYGYRVFAEMDPDHDWLSLLDSAYEILSRSVAETTTHLPPDWAEISLDNDHVGLYEEPLDVRSDFGYEAIRVYWRLGVDALLTPLDPRPRNILSAARMLPRYWKIRGDAPISLTWDGIVRHPKLDSGAVYGAILPALYTQDPTVAGQMLQRKVMPNLRPGGQWNTPNDYYSQNWLWYGLAVSLLYEDPPVFRRGSVTERLATMLKLPSLSP